MSIINPVQHISSERVCYKPDTEMSKVLAGAEVEKQRPADSCGIRNKWRLIWLAHTGHRHLLTVLPAVASGFSGAMRLASANVEWAQYRQHSPSERSMRHSTCNTQGYPYLSSSGLLRPATHLRGEVM
jgi:hypothetical protein